MALQLNSSTPLTPIAVHSLNVNDLEKVDVGPVFDTRPETKPRLKPKRRDRRSRAIDIQDIFCDNISFDFNDIIYEKVRNDRVIYGLLNTEFSKLNKIVGGLSNESQSLLLAYAEALLREQADTERTSVNVPEFPDRAEEHKDLNVVQYIELMFGHLFDGDFTRTDLKRLSPRTHQSLENFEKAIVCGCRRGRQLKLELPTTGERYSRLIQEGWIEMLRQQSVLSAGDRRLLSALEKYKSRTLSAEQDGPKAT